MNPSQNQPGEITPRGTRRIYFVSDPSSIAVGLLPDPTEADDLRRWVDMVADSGVDIFQQDAYHKGCTIYWRSDQFQYDPRRQHRRFLKMLDAGVQPLQVLLDQSHKRGMAFVAGFRMNDNHELRDPLRVADGERHYVFDPPEENWGEVLANHSEGDLPEGGWKRLAWERDAKAGPDGWTTGAVKAVRVVLDRSVPKPSGEYRFRLYERMDDVVQATLLLRGSLTEEDEVEVQLNGVPMAPALLGTSDTSYMANRPTDLRWYPVPAAAMAYGENELSITLTSGDPEASGEIVIDEVEIWVQPK